LIFPVVAPPEVPSPPKLDNIAAGVHVAWTGHGDQFRVLRRAGNEEGYILAQTAPGHEWTDTGIEYGKTYTYITQALVDLGDQRVAESDLSETRSITPKDEFPPAAPSGLSADATPNSVALNWAPNTEPDLAGYRVYRSVGDGPWQKLADLNTVPSYNDTTVERGKTCHYAVSAFDKAGNESQRSAAVEVVL
jgi:fibronectin type 3 domain-containing protein